MDRLGQLISDLERKTVGSRKKMANDVQTKIQELESKMARGEIKGNEERPGHRIAALRRQYEKGDLDLEEVKQEVDEIYGEQSDNQTYYFSDRSASQDQTQVEQWVDFQEDLDMTLDEVERVVEQFYGDQSDNQTYYSSNQIEKKKR